MIKLLFNKNLSGYFHRDIWLVTVIGMLNWMGFSMCLPFFSLYLYQERGIPMTVIGLIILLIGVVSALSQVYGGMLTDRFGRKPLLVRSMILSCITFIILAFLIKSVASVWILVIIFIACYVLMTLIRPTLSTVVTDLAERDKLTKAYGLLKAGINVGWALGPAIGGYFLTVVTYEWLFGLATLTALIPLLITAFLLHESLENSDEKDIIGIKNIGKVVKNSNFMMYIIITFLLLIGFGQMVSTLSVYSVDFAGFTTAQYGSLLTLNGIIVVLLQYPMASITSNRPKYKVLITGSLLVFAGLITFSWVGSYTLAVLAMIMLSFGEITFSPIALSVVSDIAPKRQRGLYMGTFSLSETLGHATGPFVGGILMDVFPKDPIFIWGGLGAFALAAAIGFLWWGKKFYKTPV
ncbi:MAG TPA: MFS transporter [Dehalococcoidia bacterium]|nr:MFS transporter [Dehalococcoidia bacterium]